MAYNIGRSNKNKESKYEIIGGAWDNTMYPENGPTIKFNCEFSCTEGTYIYLFPNRRFVAGTKAPNYNVCIKKIQPTPKAPLTSDEKEQRFMEERARIQESGIDPNPVEEMLLNDGSRLVF